MPQSERRAAYLAFDERTKKVVAYDAQRRPLGLHMSRVRVKRAGSACNLVSQSVLKRMESYIKLEQAAITLWGDKWNTTLTNDPAYPDSPASACISEDPQTVTLDAQPSCSSSTSTAGGRGTSTGVRFTVTQAALFPEAGVDIAAQLQMPALAVDKDTFPAAFTLQNQQTQTVDLSQDTLKDATVQASSSAPGQTCSLAITNSTCTASGTGKMQVYATGWLWFNYNEPRDGHYKWAISIDEIITDINDRSSWIEFRTAVQSWSVTKAIPSCAFAAGGESGSTTTSGDKGGSSNAVIIALPVSLATVALILGAVAFLLWRRRRSQKRQSEQNAIADTSSNRRQMSSYPDVTPIILPPPTSLPPSESMGPSISSIKGHALLLAGRGGGKPQSRATSTPQEDRLSSQSFDRTLSIGNENEALPPAYSELSAPASTSGSYSHAGSSSAGGGPR
ncbi:hypothetical protein BKA62DRAFT_723575 [Auriculariales sp. MPI-PUGE-AT-0066]|nr:hypothetical protein BKA62DRAFT_723575 [Auriculariales sp. MPI-PUGE-AT-0066]